MHFLCCRLWFLQRSDGNKTSSFLTMITLTITDSSDENTDNNNHWRWKHWWFHHDERHMWITMNKQRKFDRKILIGKYVSAKKSLLLDNNYGDGDDDDVTPVQHCIPSPAMCSLTSVSSLQSFRLTICCTTVRNLWCSKAQISLPFKAFI